jgi:hypothetical protein
MLEGNYDGSNRDYYFQEMISAGVTQSAEVAGPNPAHVTVRIRPPAPSGRISTAESLFAGSPAA